MTRLKLKPAMVSLSLLMHGLSTGLVKCHRTVNAIFLDGEAEVIFDDNADLYLVKWDYICKLPS